MRGRHSLRAGIDPRLNTLIHMQLPSTTTGVHIPAAWQYVVPNGVYSVTVSVGDKSPYDSVHTIRADVFERRRQFEASTMSKGIFGWAAAESRAKVDGAQAG